jgi:hypothetical protein
MGYWVAEHWLNLLETVGIIGSFLLAAYTARRDDRARRIANSIAINEQHRNIWKNIYEHPELARVLDIDADAKDISTGEEMFVITLISHLSTVFRAVKQGEFVTLEGLQRDVREFLILPIPKTVWEKIKPFQDEKFVVFVEKCLRS